MCRIAVSELNEKRSWFEEKGVSLIAIGFQTDVYSQKLFAESGCWDPEHVQIHFPSRNLGYCGLSFLGKHFCFVIFLLKLDETSGNLKQQ